MNVDVELLFPTVSLELWQTRDTEPIMEVAMQCSCTSFRRGVDQSPRMRWGDTNEISYAILAIYGIRGRSRTVVFRAIVQ